MSRQWMMDFDRPLSDEDKAFLRTRPGHDHMIEANEERFTGDNAEDDPGPSMEEQVKALSEKQLNAALKERNLSTDGKLADRRKRLLDHAIEHEGDDDDEDDDDNQ